ncbi:unnamed protein product [Linum tenue]|uniref:Uncharacterized protein n=1 Tax=Linum tenue TaxID=586396 RepID=A0AAV0NMP8_9ROSI|nr:unnamed protein product [Linum tenue]
MQDTKICIMPLQQVNWVYGIIHFSRWRHHWDVSVCRVGVFVVADEGDGGDPDSCRVVEIYCECGLEHIPVWV